MQESGFMSRVGAIAAAGALVLAGCGGPGEQGGGTQSPQPQTTSEAPAAPPATGGMAGHQHNPHGGPPPEGIEKAADPTYPMGTPVTLTADHMPGMAGTNATVTGAFDTTAYSVTYTPTTGGEPVVDHKWVVHEELKDPGEAPLADGTEVVLNADHMAGMNGATATIESSTQETVYMVDVTMDGMKMTNHKWVVDSEVQPSE